MDYTLCGFCDDRWTVDKGHQWMTKPIIQFILNWMGFMIDYCKEVATGMGLKIYQNVHRLSISENEWFDLLSDLRWGAVLTLFLLSEAKSELYA